MFKKLFNYAFLPLTIVSLGIFFASDADFLLYLLPSQPKNAFKDKVVWIVGASSGIGASLAEEFAKSGAKVAISARRVDMLQSLAKKIQAESPDAPAVLVVPLDVTDLAAHDAALQQVLSSFGRIDYLILNAGQSQRNLGISAPLEDTRRLMELNFLSLVAMTKAALPTLVNQHSGRIVVMSSLSGIIGTPIASSYSASKFALHGYFNALRSEMSGVHNVQVSLVCPGPVESEISLKSLRDPNLPVQVEGKKMPTVRCSSLVLKGLWHGLDEMWIAHQPFLLFTYLTQYLPGLSRLYATKIAGPARIRALTQGENIYDLNTVFGLK
jgi:dehydrogenase/reductase SDR family protein 7